MTSIEISPQAFYGVMRCPVCRVHMLYRLAAERITLKALRSLARGDGWRKNARRQWVCPMCAKPEQEGQHG